MYTACCRTCTGLEEEYGDTYCIEHDKVILDTEGHRCRSWWPNNDVLEHEISSQIFNKGTENEEHEKT